MRDIEAQLSDYLDHVVQRVDVDEVVERRVGLDPVRPISVSTPRRSSSPRRRWPIAVAAFVVVLAAGAGLALLPGGESSPGGTGSNPPSGSESVIAEPAVLFRLREAVNDGDALTAASIHQDEGVCDRFFTTGVETCSDWYSFLVGIGTEVLAADCSLDEGDGVVHCNWTVASDAHRALGVDSVYWRFTAVGVNRWAVAQPDGNLFSGTVGASALDAEFWEFVTAELVRRDPDLAEAVALSNRLPATLNADLAAVVLEAAEAFAQR